MLKRLWLFLMVFVLFAGSVEASPDDLARILAELPTGKAFVNPGYLVHTEAGDWRGKSGTLEVEVMTENGVIVLTTVRLLGSKRAEAWLPVVADVYGQPAGSDAKHFPPEEGPYIKWGERSYTRYYLPKPGYCYILQNASATYMFDKENKETTNFPDTTEFKVGSPQWFKID